MREAINTEQLESFRSQIRRFCVDRLPGDLRRKAQQRVLEKVDYVFWQKLLFQQGWAAGHWPRQYGGQAWSPLQRYIFNVETARAGAPQLFPFGLALIGPVIYTFGTERTEGPFLAWHSGLGTRVVVVRDIRSRGWFGSGLGGDPGRARR